MKIKLLPFDEAVEKAKGQGGVLAKVTNYKEIIGISKHNWKKLEKQVLTVYEKDAFYHSPVYSFPKCCCEVVEE